ncbi:unnamed protein product (macronuclear) [Paramecium tetraurelia]|uniref:HMG box domain-containing protein n=1 Tax=Paramecium tetraurelia TaxID=5888 RepID=A0DZ94_PARTE|nr:uncharacterized protein GSPATT00003330001 [Paramecium tetraurelia]CAK88361.1 unnamed protein product [Paramecium tetraurelia]|eukprot:XP_001455758.1 hypothetical protein (macronuclear) [Paramecium tetraurelia strain d4-2]
MEQYCQQFLKGQPIIEFNNDKPEKKKERDPNAPKRPLTPFFLFSQKYRDKVLERNPGIDQRDYSLEVKLTQISQMAGQKWNSMSEEEKQPYVDQYNEAKNKYDGDLKVYNDKHGLNTNEKKRKKSEKLDDKSVKSGQDYPFNDVDSESIQPAAKHQQQIKQQQTQKKVSQNINSDDDQPIQQTTQDKSQKGNSSKSKNNQDVDDDLQREIIQVINNDKSQKRQRKK